MGLYPAPNQFSTYDGRSFENILTNYSISVFGGGWELSTSISYQRGFPLPQDPPSQEDWQVGFIQNVLRETCTCRYASGRTIRFSHPTPVLDAEREGNQAWILRYARTNVPGESTSLRPWAPINYGGGGASLVGNARMTNIALSMQDYPRAQYYNFFGGVNSGDQLRQVRNSIEFRIWLAAKRTSSRVDDPRSYNLLALSSVFSLTYQVDIPGLNPAFSASARGAAMAGGQGVQLTDPIVQCLVSRGNWGQAGPNAPRPVVSGPTANETLGGLHNRHGVGPLTMWGR